jgi:hypothetical protein
VNSAGAGPRFSFESQELIALADTDSASWTPGIVDVIERHSFLEPIS